MEVDEVDAPQRLSRQLLGPIILLLAGMLMLSLGVLGARPCLAVTPSPCSTARQWPPFAAIVIGTGGPAIAVTWTMLLVARWVGDNRGGHP